MKIYFDGCSWTRGAELENRKEERFSRLVADHFGAEEKNISLSGGSNDRIVRNLLVNKNIEEYDLAVIEMTFPARTEYYSGTPFQKGMMGSTGWISVNPKYNFSHMLSKIKKKQLEDDIVYMRGVWKNLCTKFTQYEKFWGDYYRTITTHEFFQTKEKINKLTIENHCQIKGVPLVICTINPWTKENFELQMNNKINNPSGKGHPDAEGHRIIANKIIDIAKGKL